MPHLPPRTPAEVVKILEQHGFRKVRQKGSHAFYSSGRVILTVPMHRRELAKGTLRAIIRQSQLSIDLFAS